MSNNKDYIDCIDFIDSEDDENPLEQNIINSENLDEENPEEENLDEENPDEENPDEENPDEENPENLLTPMLADELYAMYIDLEDEGANQNEIINELKYILGNKGYTDSNINIILSKFLDRFGVNLTPDEIGEVRYVNNQMQTILTNLINITNNNNSIITFYNISNQGQNIQNGNPNNILGQMLNVLNQPINPPIMEDVITTLDNTEMEKLKEYVCWLEL
mgnify:CR=1 FL=1